MKRIALLCLLFLTSYSFAQPGINAKTGKPFPRGLTPTPKAVLAAMPKFRPTAPMVPTQFAVVPSKLSMWYNDTYGDCVTAEEAFAKACQGIFISDAVVYAWAKSHGVLDGANLQPVIQSMQQKGFAQDGNLYNDGKETVVDYSSEPILRAALATGPVKLGLDANALPSGAGNNQGWYAFGGKPGQFNNEDHCTGLSGFGTAKFCFDSLHLPVPAGVDPNKPDCYIFFTWSTMGVVDHPWIMSTVSEALVRNPTNITVGTGIPTPDPPLTPPAPLTVTVPSLVGMTYDVAKAACTTVGLIIQGPPQFDPKTVITDQSPKAGETVNVGSTVVVTIPFVPPPPPPNSGVTLTIDGPLAPGTYKVVPSNAITITGDMTLKDLLEALNKAANSKGGDPKVSSLDKDVSELKRGMDAILKVLLPEEKK